MAIISSLPAFHKFSPVFQLIVFPDKLFNKVFYKNDKNSDKLITGLDIWSIFGI